VPRYRCSGWGTVVGIFYSRVPKPRGGANGVFFGNPIQLAYQLTGVVATIVWSCFFTALILIPLKYTIGLSALPEEALSIGMDKMYHGSTANPEAEVSSEPDDARTETEISEGGKVKRRTKTNEQLEQIDEDVV